MPHRAPAAPGRSRQQMLSGKPIRYYCDSTIAFPLFCEYAVGSPNGRRPRKELVHKRADLVASLTRQAKAALEERKAKV